jgi:pyrroline-5-carboxylate reductase
MTNCCQNQRRRGRRNPIQGFATPTMMLKVITHCLLLLRSCQSFAPNNYRGLERRSSASISLRSVSSGNSQNDGMTVGFIGCGTIASAIATGMATQTSVNVDSIVVSRRSKSKSTLLREQFPHLVDVADDNQQIVDQCQYIFLTVLPQQTSSVLRSLNFTPNQTLISLVSTACLEDLVRDSKLNPAQVSKMICLPSVAKHHGVCLHCFSSKEASLTPANAILTQLFTAMGGVVTLDSESDLQACMMTTCTMGPIYGMMKQSRDWLLQSTDNNLTKEQASYLVIKQMIGAVLDADRIGADGSTSETDPDRLEMLIEEQTPGGLNEQALANYERLGGPAGQVQVMDAILSRIRGESDGFVET